MSQITYDIARFAMDRYLQKALAAMPEAEHPRALAAFDRHMHEIADYCDREFMAKECLTTAFIRGLHRVISPTKKPLVGRNAKGHLVVISVPGSYKTLPNRVQGSGAEFTAPANVKDKMERLVAEFNDKKNANSANNIIKDHIFKIILEFLLIHPFGDENGRIACMLVDLFLVKYKLKPIYFYRATEFEIVKLGEACAEAQNQGSPKVLLDFARNFRPDAMT